MGTETQPRVSLLLRHELHRLHLQPLRPQSELLLKLKPLELGSLQPMLKLQELLLLLPDHGLLDWPPSGPSTKRSSLLRPGKAANKAGARRASTKRSSLRAAGPKLLKWAATGRSARTGVVRQKVP